MYTCAIMCIHMYMQNNLNNLYIYIMCMHVA